VIRQDADDARDAGHAGRDDDWDARLKVAYVIGTTSGGTGRHVAMLAQGCAERGAAVAVLGPADTQQRFFHDHGTPVAGPGGDLPRSWKFVRVDIADRPRPARDGAAVLRLRSLLARSSPDIVHAHGLRAGALAALALAGAPARRSALLVTVHNAPPAGGATGAIYAVLERIVARRADAVASVSGDLAARMRRLWARDGGRALVPPLAAAAPPPDAVARVRQELGGGRPVVLAVGRLAAQKGFGTLLAAAGRWQQRDPAPLLVIAGEGPLAGRLDIEARSAGLAVRFLGQRSDIPVLLAAADVVVVASSWEGQPLSVQETLRAGRPLVATRVGGIPELTGEDGALLVPPGDADRLASAVLSVLDDPGLAEKLGAAARGRAAALPGETAAVDAVLALYRRITDGHPEVSR
jgi:glycosyltransferase involved in cell wall biosynthesis